MSQLLPIPFRAGIDEGVDPKQLPPGTLKVGKNCRQDKAGRIVKRHGTIDLNGVVLNATTLDALRLLSGGRVLSASDGTYAFVRSAAGSWSRTDRVPALASTYQVMADTTRTVSQATVAVVGGYLVEAFSTAASGYSAPASGPVYVQIRDLETGAVTMPPTLVDSDASQVKVFKSAVSGVAYVVYLTSAGDLKRKLLNTGFHTLGVAVTIVGSVAVWDGVYDTALDVLFLVWGEAAGLTVGRCTLSTGALPTAALLAGAATYKAVAIDVTGGSIVRIVYSTTAPTTKLITRVASTLGAIAGPTTIDAKECISLSVLGDIGNDDMIVAYSFLDGTLFHITTKSICYDDVTHAVNLTTGGETTNHIALASRIFALEGRYYFAATVAVIPPAIATSNDTYVSPQSAILVECNIGVDITVQRPPHRRAATLESRTSALQINVVTQPATDSDGHVFLAVARKQREPVGTEAVPLSAVTHRIEALGEDWGRPLLIGESSLCVASSPFHNDGATAHPYGFIHEPDILAVSIGAGASGAMAAGDYVYVCVFEWRDARGVLHRSAPSAPVTATGVVATGSVTLRIAYTGIDGKQTAATGFGSSAVSPVRIAIYRTEVNADILHRLTHEPSYSVFINDPLSASATFTDTKADSSIAGSGPVITLASRPQLYSNNELAEINPAAATTGTIHRSRAFLVSGDRRTLQFSKKFEEDVGLAPGFNEEFVLTFTSDKHWVASLDDKLIVGGTVIDAVFGDGPASDGSGIDWQIQRIHADASCTNPKSVAVIPPGLVFRSPRGFELLGRGLNVAYIGQPVEDTLAAYPNVTSAVVVPTEQEVRFTCTNDAGTAGVVIVLDYAFRAWYVRDYWNGVAFAAAFVDAALVDDTYYLVDSSGSVREETTAHAYDDPIAGGTKYVSMRAEVPVYPAGAAGWHRLRKVQVVGESLDHHKLTIAISRDFATSSEQTKTFLDGSTTTTPGPLEAAEVVVKNQKRQAAVITIYDEEPAVQTWTTGKGPSLELLALYIEPKEGPAKVPAAKRA